MKERGIKRDKERERDRQREGERDRERERGDQNYQRLVRMSQVIV